MRLEMGEGGGQIKLVNEYIMVVLGRNGVEVKLRMLDQMMS